MRTLMAVVAHPDDEAFGMGGTLSRYAAEGCAVYVVTATRGEAGQIAVAEAATPASLPLVRERELRCACRAYGAHPPIFLDYLDGQLPIVNQGQAVGKLVRVIRELRPEVVLTFGPDGIYGHYDHIAVHRWATIAYDLANDPDCFPGQIEGECQPHQVSKLYYQVLPEEELEEWRAQGQQAAVMMDGVPFPMIGWKRGDITTVIDISAHAEAKRAGLLCHRSQVGDESAWTDEGARASRLFREETYVLARSTVEHREGVEDDLFAGLNE
jgi:LmbE family N-acetylglucosaminyl deacetylase